MPQLPSDFLFKYGQPSRAASPAAQEQRGDLPRTGPAPVAAARLPEPVLAALRAFGKGVLGAIQALGPDAQVNALVDAMGSMDIKDLRAIIDWLVAENLVQVVARDRYGNDRLALTEAGERTVQTGRWPPAIAPAP